MNTEAQQPQSREDSDEDIQGELDWNIDPTTNISFNENLDELDSSHHNIPHPTYSPHNDMARRREHRSKLSVFVDKCLESSIYPFMQSCCRNKLIWFIMIQFFFLFLRITRSLDSVVAEILIIVPISLIILYIVYRYCKYSMTRDQRNRNRRPELPMRYISPHHVDERVLQQLVFQTLRNRLELIRDNHSAESRLPSRDELRDFRRDIRNMLMELHNFDSLNTERIFAMGIQQQPVGLTQDEISAIKVDSYCKEKDKDYDICSICIDEFKDNDSVRVLNCGHQFHVNCVDQWLKQSTSCPNCKSELRVGGNESNNHNLLDLSIDRSPHIPHMTIIDIPDIVDNVEEEFSERDLE